MAELKTKKTEASVEDFLNNIKDEQERKDCFEIVRMMRRATKSEPMTWGSSIIGFGSIRFRYASGRELDWMIVGFSPRKQNLTLYLARSLSSYTDLFEKLGKHKIGGGCLYIKSLKDVDTKVLKELIQLSISAAIRK